VRRPRVGPTAHASFHLGCLAYGFNAPEPSSLVFPLWCRRSAVRVPVTSQGDSLIKTPSYGGGKNWGKLLSRLLERQRKGSVRTRNGPRIGPRKWAQKLGGQYLFAACHDGIMDHVCSCADRWTSSVLACCEDRPIGQASRVSRQGTRGEEGVGPGLMDEARGGRAARGESREQSGSRPGRRSARVALGWLIGPIARNRAPVRQGASHPCTPVREISSYTSARVHAFP
jgi:hypothetical protein